jgi:hypothetical protein
MTTDEEKKEKRRKYQQVYNKQYKKNSREYSRQYYQDNKGNCQEMMRQWHLQHKYGITLDDYNERLSTQNGGCAICKEVVTHTLHVDHDHITKLIRGLLCNRCNHVLGLVRDNEDILKSMILYLKGGLNVQTQDDA